MSIYVLPHLEEKRSFKMRKILLKLQNVSGDSHLSLMHNLRCELEAYWAVESLLNAKVDVNGISVNHPSSSLIFAIEKVLFYYKIRVFHYYKYIFQ